MEDPKIQASSRFTLGYSMNTTSLVPHLGVEHDVKSSCKCGTSWETVKWRTMFHTKCGTLSVCMFKGEICLVFESF